MLKTQKKGLSAVVTTLLIILLVLVAVGIIWVVVRNVVQEGAEQIDVSARCTAVDLRAVGVVETSAGVYDITLQRRAGGDDIAGVKIVILADTASSGVLPDLFLDMEALDTVTETGVAGPAGATSVEFTPYFLDSSGNELLCSQIGEFNF